MGTGSCSDDLTVCQVACALEIFGEPECGIACAVVYAACEASNSKKSMNADATATLKQVTGSCSDDLTVCQVACALEIFGEPECGIACAVAYAACEASTSKKSMNAKQVTGSCSDDLTVCQVACALEIFGEPECGIACAVAHAACEA